jgi:hypothetical protein
MFEHTDIREAPWYVVDADDKRRARLNCIHHLLGQVDYEDVLPKDRITFPDRQTNKGYERPPKAEQNWVPDNY